MTFSQVISILFFHWLGDFVFQSDKWAKEKSEHAPVLVLHCLTYTGVMLFGGLLCGWIPLCIDLAVFAVAFFFSHFIIDGVSSNINKKLYESGDIHNFFVGVGLDQVLHYAVVFGILYLLHRTTADACF